MKESLESIESFRKYSTSYLVPAYFKEYVETLSYEQLEWFYNQVKETLKYLVIEEYLIYKFKWIMKRPFTDLTKEIYIEYLHNPEMFTFDIINPEREKELDLKYKNDYDVKRYYNSF